MVRFLLALALLIAAPAFGQGNFTGQGLPQRDGGGTIGETLESAGTSSTIASVTNLASVSLSPGSWIIYATALANFSSSGASDYLDFAVATANNSLTGAISFNSVTYGVSRGHTHVGTTGRGLATLVMRVKLTAAQTYYLNTQGGGTGQVMGHLVAVRSVQ